MTNQEAIELLKAPLKSEVYVNLHIAFSEALRMAIKALEQQESERWIPVSERLPEKDGTYIVTQATHSLRDYGKILRYDTCQVDFTQGRWRRAKNLEVIAWRPLPKPYTE